MENKKEKLNYEDKNACPGGINLPQTEDKSQNAVFSRKIWEEANDSIRKTLSSSPTSDWMEEKEFNDIFDSLFQWRYQYDSEYEALDGNTGSFWSNEKVKELKEKFISRQREEVIKETVQRVLSEARVYTHNEFCEKKGKQFKKCLVCIAENLLTQIKKEE